MRSTSCSFYSSTSRYIKKDRTTLAKMYTQAHNVSRSFEIFYQMLNTITGKQVLGTYYGMLRGLWEEPMLYQRICKWGFNVNSVRRFRFWALTLIITCLTNRLLLLRSFLLLLMPIPHIIVFLSPRAYIDDAVLHLACQQCFQ